MTARNADRQRARREPPKPDPGIYCLDRGILRVRHSKTGDGWYAHRMQLTRHGRIEWVYLGQCRMKGAVLLPVDPDRPVPCTRCPEYASGQHTIAGDVLCNACMTEHLRKVS